MLLVYPRIELDLFWVRYVSRVNPGCRTLQTQLKDSLKLGFPDQNQVERFSYPLIGGLDW